MPIFGGEPENLSPHYRYFERMCIAKGATKSKAERWAYRMVRIKGKRMPVQARGSGG